MMYKSQFNQIDPFDNNNCVQQKEYYMLLHRIIALGKIVND